MKKLSSDTELSGQKCIHASVPILRIAGYRVSDRCQVRPDLVAASCQKIDIQKRQQEPALL
jgi:hypothetical protein